MIDDGFIQKSKLGLLIVDVQDRLFPHIDHSFEVLSSIKKTIQLATLFSIPSIVTEQYPQGLGSTLLPLKELFEENQKIYSKTTFSAAKDASVLKDIENHGFQTLILVGIETHICILQTAKDLLSLGKNVIVLNDATGSCTPYHFLRGTEELKAEGARISCVESFFYELLTDSSDPLFKSMLTLIKSS